jgi:uncharacterized heparinase superfamily protein
LSWPIDRDLQGTEVEDQLWKMHLHYMEYLESVSDADFQALVEDWIVNNRPYRPGYWRDVWNSYTTSLRVVVWLQQLARRRQQLSPELVLRMASSLVEQIDFVHRHLETDLRGNHLIKNLKALLWGARSFCLPAAIRWRDTAHALLRRELAEQVLPDGVHYERSPSYHCQVFADLVECFHILEDEALKAQLGAGLARTAAATADLTHPDGRVALFNDAGFSMAPAPGECLAAYRRVSGQTIRRGRQIHLESAGFFGMHTDRFYVIVGDGRNRKSLAYVENGADFLVHALSFPPGVAVYNYATKPDADTNQLVVVTYQALNLARMRPIRLPTESGSASA